MGPTPFYGARAEPPPPQKKADFAMKQTNICHLSGDITSLRRLPTDSVDNFETDQTDSIAFDYTNFDKY